MRRSRKQSTPPPPPTRTQSEQESSAAHHHLGRAGHRQSRGWVCALVRVHGSVAGWPAGLRADKINTPSLASSSHGWALWHDQFYELNPFEGMATPS